MRLRNLYNISIDLVNFRNGIEKNEIYKIWNWKIFNEIIRNKCGIQTNDGEISEDRQKNLITAHLSFLYVFFSNISNS